MQNEFTMKYSNTSLEGLSVGYTLVSPPFTTRISVKYSDPNAAPLRAHAYDAGADLKAMTAHDIPPGGMQVVDTGIAVQIPEYFVGLVFSRSGMGKVEVTLANSVGVIDESYRGNIKVMIKNHSKENYFTISKYDRVAQLVIVPIMLATFEPFEGTDDDWNDTQRGQRGFGSTGK